ncbi:phage tail protein [Symbiopectobacterium sp. RP]|uniref:phage tail-collar fiber domain-containing protein n=1 Tax=Symbiopectobacterium sp. RP TaxID=3248553 RepID=UPI003D2C4EBB
MSTKYFALLTHIGAARLASATALGSRLDITHMAVGDGGGVLPTPNPAQTRLINETRRAAINSVRVDPNNTNQIIAEQVIPENEGGFWIRELGLFDAEGNLIAVANCAETYKPQLQEGSGRIQTVRMILIVSSAETVSLKIDPAVVLATRGYVDEAIATHEKGRKYPDATLEVKGFVQLSSATNSASETLAATPKAVKAANDNANGRVPSGRKVNGKALKADITLSAGDVGAYTRAETDTRVTVATTAAANANNNAEGRVPAGRKVNSKPLTADITLGPVDVGALAKDQNGADIPDKALFRQNIDLVKQTGGTDANAGRVLVLPANSTGAFGVGGAANNPVSQRGGFFAYSPESSALPDIGLNMNGVGYQSAYDTNRRGQIFQSFNDGALRYRVTTSNTAADNTTPWRVAFDNINLVPTRDDQTTLSLTSAAAIHAWALANTSRSFRNDGINTDASTIRFGSGAFTKVNGTYSILTASSSASTPGLKIQAGDADGYVSYNVWTDKNLQNPLSASEIVGIPLPFPGEVPPSGWLKCNGQTFDRAQYPVLASRYPTGYLPDLRGEFIRGVDAGRGVDGGRALLSAQGDAIRNITGKFANNGLAWAEGTSSSVGGGAFTRLGGRIPSNNDFGSVGCQYTFDASNVVPTAAENRPRNIAFNYIVRAA